MLRRLLGPPIVACSAALAGAGPGTDYGIGVTLLGGHDSNPLEQSGSGPDGWLGQLGIDGFVRREASRRVTLFGDGELRGRRHESSLSDADDVAGNLRAGVSLAATPRLALLCGAEHALYRATFLDGETGEPYEVDSTPIPDRLDRDSTGWYANARWTHDRRLMFFLDTSFHDVGYREDYRETGLEPLDHAVLAFEPGVSLAVGHSARVMVSYVRGAVTYDEQSALDSTGDRVEEVRRSYRSSTLRVRARIAAPERWTFHAGASTTQREDSYAGFYDYGSWSGYASVDRDLGRAGTVRLYASHFDLDFANATVTGDPEDDKRNSTVHRLLARYEREVHRSAGAFVEIGLEEADSRDPAYAYDSDWLMAGIRYRH
jgi:hypothetical protein